LSLFPNPQTDGAIQAPFWGPIAVQSCR